MRLRVLTYNMHKGFGFFSRQYVLEELRKAIRKIDADLVFLQEVMGVHPAHANFHELNSQFEYLADKIWPHFAYGRNALYSHGHHGNAILSKFPFVTYENINISTNAFERRGLLHAQIQLPGQTSDVHLVCLHLDLLEKGRNRQMDNLIARVRERVPPECPLIVAGDFNDWKGRLSKRLETELSLIECGLLLYGKHARTFPSWKPLLALDRIYVRHFEIIKQQVLFGPPWSQLSDHAGVVGEIEVNVAPNDTRAD